MWWTYCVGGRDRDHYNIYGACIVCERCWWRKMVDLILYTV